MRYGKWTISYNPKPKVLSLYDFDFVHDDYDGADIDYETASKDQRCGNASSIGNAMKQIDDIEAELSHDNA